MVLDFEPANILEEPSLQAVESATFSYAEQLAVLGAIDAARDLTALSYQHSTTGDYSHLSARLAFAWNETGQWPAGMPETQRSLEHLDSLRDSYNKLWGGIYERNVVPQSMRTWDENGLDACLRFESNSGVGSPYDDECALNERLVKALDIAMHLSGECKPSSVTSNVEIGAAVGKDTSYPPLDGGWIDLSRLGKRSADIVDRIVERWNTRGQVQALTQAEKLWPLFISGALARAAGLSRLEIDAKAKLIVDTFAQRLDEPYARTALTGKGLKQMLDVADEVTTKGAAAAVYFEEMGVLDDEHDNRPKTLFKPPASEEDVAALEKRLGCALPDDYKSFLRISNGFWYDVGSSADPSGFFSGIIPEAPLHPLEDVKWDDDDVWKLPLDLLYIPREIEDLGDRSIKGPYKFPTPVPLIDRVLRIGAYGIDNLWLISPDQVEKARQAYAVMYERSNAEQKAVIDRAIETFAGSRKAFEQLDWACVNWTSGGAADFTSYPSFGRYLEIRVAEGLKSKEKS